VKDGVGAAPDGGAHLRIAPRFGGKPEGRATGMILPWNASAPRELFSERLKYGRTSA
jgi:hypothetical protein